MGLKNANSNGCNVTINNVHLMFLFFSKNYLGLQSLFLSRDSITTHKLPQTKTYHNFWFIDPNGIMQSFPRRYKSKESISNLFYF